MEETVFTKIIKGEIPSNKVYEDELTYAFLDHNPKTPGHTLVISKMPAPYVWELPDDDYAALMSSVKKVARRIKEVLGPEWVGMQVEGVAVPHAHVHVFPFSSVEEYNQSPDPNKKPSAEELAEMAQKLAF
ncbi:MAG TPA: HIT family protein [Candidatus Saccharimonadales bacterium]|nr:HIT family protein [Candidatus Saccharimonadales bacterium]